MEQAVECSKEAAFQYHQTARTSRAELTAGTKLRYLKRISRYPKTETGVSYGSDNEHRARQRASYARTRTHTRWCQVWLLTLT
jgi:hypothetical protein